MNLRIIPRKFYERSTVLVAQELLGCCIVRSFNNRILVGMITETEAYQGADDPASHAFHGKTKRNFPMFGPCGMSYVYFTYGMHFCFNIVARNLNQEAGAVLIRAIKPISGLEMMQHLRGKKTPLKNLTNGPAKLTQALAIDRCLNNCDLTQECELFIASHDFKLPKDKICVTPRIGIKVARAFLWRFRMKAATIIEK